MNDSLSFSDSTPSSSNHSNSNSLNRSFVNSSLYGASDYLSFHLKTIGIQTKKRSKSLVSNYRDYLDQNLKQFKNEVFESKKVILYF
jgi:hypothetical protein